MSAWPWSFGSNRVSIAGIVVDARTLTPISGVSAQITAMPAAFEQLLSLFAAQYGAGWTTSSKRPDLTSTADDGGFSFANLPPGSYTVSFSIPGVSPGFCGTYGTAEQSYAVPGDFAFDPTSGTLLTDVPQISMPPTAVVGTVVSGDPEDEGAPLPMARVRVRGSGEVAYTDADGAFYLTGVEPGTRTLEIFSYGYSTTSYPPFGYQPTTVEASIIEGNITNLGTILLGAAPMPSPP